MVEQSKYNSKENYFSLVFKILRQTNYTALFSCSCWRCQRELNVINNHQYKRHTEEPSLSSIVCKSTHIIAQKRAVLVNATLALGTKVCN